MIPVKRCFWNYIFCGYGKNKTLSKRYSTTSFLVDVITVTIEACVLPPGPPCSHQETPYGPSQHTSFEEHTLAESLHADWEPRYLFHLSILWSGQLLAKDHIYDNNNGFKHNILVWKNAILHARHVQNPYHGRKWDVLIWFMTIIVVSQLPTI